jgi:uncharacterized protein (DUF1800 family)
MYLRFKHYAAVGVLLAVSVSTSADPLSAEQQAAHVLNRLAYGPKPGDINRVATMGVRAYIDAQLNPTAIDYPPALAERLLKLDAPHRSAGAALGEFLASRKEANDKDAQPLAKQRRREQQAASTREIAEARLLRAIDSPRQLEEVMVDFWFNHFNVFIGKGETRALVASYERDAIRPHALGSFRALLGATARHPAMLHYLDNMVSSAQAAPRPKQKPRGLNENYARELMELHTLGVDGGYTQQDVTELARMLTGWTYDRKALVAANETFRFDPRRHDHGVKLWLGKTVADQGQMEGEFALDVLAVHPATARHLSYKLARYFVQDEPPAALVKRMAATWSASGADIGAVLRVLFHSDEFMDSSASGAKYKTPYQYVISAARASGAAVDNVAPLLGALNQLGMPLYGCPTPDGYHDTQQAWLNPGSLSRRITLATSLASGRTPLARAGAKPAPLAATALAATLGPSVSRATADVVASSPEALRAALLLGSPDFMQR